MKNLIKKDNIDLVSQILDRLQDRINQKVKSDKCSICNWYGNLDFCTIGEAITFRLVGIRPVDLPTHIRKKERQISDEQEFLIYHKRIHLIFANAAIIGFLFHLVQTLPPLISLIKWFRNSIDTQIDDEMKLHIIKVIQDFANHQVYDKQKDTLVEIRMDSIIEPIYDEKTKIINQINTLNKEISVKELDMKIEDIENSYRFIEDHFIELAVKFTFMTKAFKIL